MDHKQLKFSFCGMPSFLRLPGSLRVGDHHITQIVGIQIRVMIIRSEGQYVSNFIQSAVSSIQFLDFLISGDFDRQGRKLVRLSLLEGCFSGPDEKFIGDQITEFFSNINEYHLTAPLLLPLHNLGVLSELLIGVFLS